MADVLPPIDGAFNTQLRDVLKGFSPVNREVAFSEFMKTFEDPTTIKRLNQDITSLTDNTNLIDGYFREILSELSQVIYPTGGTNSKDDWNAHYKSFRDLCEQSRETAWGLRHHLDEFINIVIPAYKKIKGPNDDRGRGKALIVLNSFLADLGVSGDDKINLAKFKKEAKTHNEDFAKLSVKVIEFQSGFVQFVRNRSNENPVEVGTALQSLELLNNELSTINSQIRMLWQALVVTATGDGVALWGAFALSGPYALAAAFAAGLLSFGVGLEITRLIEARGVASTKRQEIVEARDNLAISTLMEWINNQQLVFGQLIEKLDNLRDLWTGMAGDAFALQKALEATAKGSMEDYETFESRVEHCRKLYIMLRVKINAYTHQS